MTINAIIAFDEKYGIGKNGSLPWEHNPSDMKWFKECTTGHVVVMGRKTWESLGSKKLPNRINIVITRSKIEGTPDGVYQGDIQKLIRMIKLEYRDLKTWIIGGSEIYKQSLSLCDNIYTTQFKGDYECDTFVPMEEYLAGYFKAAYKERDGLTFTIWSKL